MGVFIIAMQTQKLDEQLTVQLIPPLWRTRVQNTEQFGSFETIDRIDPQLLAEIGQIKRFLERWKADRKFREQLAIDPYGACVRYGLKVNPEDIRPKWDKNFANISEEEIAEEFPLLKLFNQFYDQHLERAVNVGIPISSSANLNFWAWRERQIARVGSQVKAYVHREISHFTNAFELSKGCSVGCRFCGVAAPRLNDIFFYNPDNAKLWREVLEVMTSILGSAFQGSFCYWATDPFDNPDYEKFCADYYAITEVFPQTTTAQALKNPQRTRAFLEFSRKKNSLFNRFSILSLKMFEQIHQEFSPEELLTVKLVLLNDEAEDIKAHAGRQRERNLQENIADQELPDQGTIACVSGFLFNMVERSVKLISPCNANERWPLGYIVYDQGTFTNADELSTLIQRMIRDRMPLTVQPDDLMCFRQDLKYESLSDGFHLANKVKTFKFVNDPCWRDLGEMIHGGNKTAEQITQLLAAQGVLSEQTSYYLNVLFERAVLDSEPKP